MADWTLPNLR